MEPIAIGIVVVVPLEMYPRPFVIAKRLLPPLAICSPIGHQTNIYVFGWEGIGLGGFWQVGLFLTIICFVGCVTITLLIDLEITSSLNDSILVS